MKISHVKFNELLKDNKFSKAYGKVQDKRSLVGKTVMEEQYNFTIPNGLANVISNGNNVTYTLLINRINDEENSFENLIIKVDSLSQITAYIIKYKSDNVITPENFNLSSSAIQKHITPIIYNASSYSITGKEDAYDCYDVTVWVCSYAGHTLEGTCTHGEWATETICFASSGGSNDSGDSGAGSGPPLDMPNGGGGGGAPIGNNTPVGNPVNNCGSCNVPVYTAPVLEFEEEEVIENNIPCDMIKKLQGDTNFKARMANLIDAARNWNFERCYVMYDAATPTTTTNNYTYQTFDGTINSPGSTYTGNTTMKGIIHSHYNGLISIFTAGDLEDLYLKLKNYPDITDDFFIGVVTSSNTAYLLQVPDRATFIAFGDKFLSDQAKVEDFTENKIFKKYNIQPNNSNSDNELGFLKMMTDLNMGVSLASVDFNAATTSAGIVFDTWTKKEYNKKTKTIIPSNCN